MKGMKRTLTTCFLAFILIFSAFSICSGQQPKPQPFAQGTIPKPRVDLAIVNIYSTGNCPCQELEKVNALFVNGISVTIANRGSMTAGGMLELTFFDLSSNSLQTRTVAVTPIGLSQERDVVVFSTPKLIKRSSGIKAEIKVAPPITDANLTDNVMTVNKCILHPIQ